ncbi:UbiA-like polyprenyltransferase [Chrysiogenes arsenatis]|uniref:UbiA-like polyprenyltransferase n=1 Tax=Chrysiogenes arsenatis TaxID=309797 RepID=UPI0006878EA7|nr:UbiA-like polyprenyltransferase [Chrysiogenes arsenatis]
MIKFSHTLFALPFALMAMLAAAQGLPSGATIFWIVVAMVGARSAGMALNRIIDADIDKANPRTASRHLPSGKLSHREAWFFTLASLLIFIVAAYMLNDLAFKLSPVAVAFLVLYPYMKRLHNTAHIILGLTLAMAPIGATIAVRGEVTLFSILLGCFVTLWVAGFDIIYATQDIQFDRSQGLKSIPARYGHEKSLAIASSLHMLAYIALFLSYIALSFAGVLYLIGILVVGGMLIYEHHLAGAAENPDDIDTAFFTVNSYIAVVMLVAICLDWAFVW